MIEVRVGDLLRERGWTPYRLAKEAGLTMPVAYRLASAEGEFRRIDMRTLDAICRALDCQPGDVLKYVPDTKRKRGR